MILLLKELGIPMSGVVENMVMKPSDYVKSDVLKLGLDYLGSIEYDEAVEESLGDVDALSETGFYKRVGEILPGHL
jgi:hypothetical protein